jgi:hypothetical protein
MLRSKPRWRNRDFGKRTARAVKLGGVDARAGDDEGFGTSSLARGAAA